MLLTPEVGTVGEAGDRRDPLRRQLSHQQLQQLLAPLPRLLVADQSEPQLTACQLAPHHLPIAQLSRRPAHRVDGGAGPSELLNADDADGRPQLPGSARELLRPVGLAAERDHDGAAQIGMGRGPRQQLASDVEVGTELPAAVLVGQNTDHVDLPPSHLHDAVGATHRGEDQDQVANSRTPLPMVVAGDDHRAVALARRLSRL